MKLVAWKPVRKNGLAGFVTVELDTIGMRLIDLPVYSSGTYGPWVSLPTKPVLDENKRHKSVQGRWVWAPCAEWTDRKFSDSFTRQVLVLLREAHPDALPAA